MSKETILIVDDDEGSRESLTDILALHGYQPLVAGSSEAAEKLLRSTAVDAVLLDLRLPDRSGLEVLRFIKEAAPDTEVLMVSGFGNFASAVEAMRCGAVGYVEKPVNVEEVLSGLQKALTRQRMGRELRQENSERTQELKLLLESTRTISSGLEIAKLLRTLAQQMVERLQVTLCQIAVLEGERSRLTIRAIFPIRSLPAPRLGQEIDLGQAQIYRRVVEQRATLLIRSDNPAWRQDGQLRLALAEDAASAILLPMVAKGELVGVVTLVEARRWERSPFTPEKIALCEAMASGAAIAIQNALLFHERESAHLATLVSLASALDARERETGAHSDRVREYALAIARALPIPEGQLQAIAAGALLHDIGKIGVRDAILLKPAALTTKEWDAMRQHPAIGARIIQSLTHIEGAREIVLSHHERWDGSGYPAHLRGAAIPLGARIFAVADALDAITSDRPYRPKASLAAAREEIRRCSGTQFDPDVVQAFLGVPPATWEILQHRTHGNGDFSAAETASDAGAPALGGGISVPSRHRGHRDARPGRRIAAKARVAARH